MNIEEIREYCLAKNAVTESFPFDEETLVFKVAGKMFAVSALEKKCNIIVKADPDVVTELSENNSNIIRAPHFNKTYWIQLFITENENKDFIKKLIDDSYILVVKKMSKKNQSDLL